MAKTFECFITDACGKEPAKRTAFERECLKIAGDLSNDFAARKYYAQHKGRYVVAPADDSDLFVIWDNLQGEIVEQFCQKQDAQIETRTLNKAWTSDLNALFEDETVN